MAIVDRIQALDEIDKNLDALAKRSGLLSFKSGDDWTLTVNDVQEIRKRISAWTIENFMIEKKKTISMAALSKGHRGTALLPYFDKQGSPLCFRIPLSVVNSEKGEGLKQLYFSSTMEELIASARSAAIRFQKLKKLEQEAISYISQGIGKQKKNKDLKFFLEQTRQMNIVDTDKFGQIIPVGVKKLSMLKIILDRPFTVLNYRKQELFYEYLAKSLKQRKNDPKLERIMESCLLDSLLRGWELAASDREIEDKFKAWSERVRNLVWQELDAQAWKKGINIAELLGEGTVFQVRRENGDYKITPLFVADVEQTRISVKPESKMVHYSLPWHERQLKKLDEKEIIKIKENHATPSDYAETTARGVIKNLENASAKSVLNQVFIQTRIPKHRFYFVTIRIKHLFFPIAYCKNPCINDIIFFTSCLFA